MQTFYCKEYDKKYKQCNQFSAVVLLRTTHWVVLEFDLDKPRSTDKLTVTIIDSMEKDKGVSYNEEIEQFNLDFLLMISLLTITEDKHPKEPFYLNKAVNPVWISFLSNR